MRRAIFFAIAALALPSAGCQVLEIEDFPCPPDGTELTYQNFGQGFFIANCNRCHSAEVGDRQGAPEGYAFESLDQVRKHKARIFARAAGPNDSMPIGPDDPPREERDKLAEWLACGAP
jgi:hypothetical protein